MTNKTTLSVCEVGQSQGCLRTLLELRDKTTGQQLINSAKEALAFARGEPNNCVVHSIDWDWQWVKPLFIPLKTEYFNAFRDGTKTHEFRLGKRWNEKNCKIGRKVTLSKGYGKYERLNGVITSFEVVPVNALCFSDVVAVTDIYGIKMHKLQCFYVAKIGIKIESINTEAKCPVETIYGGDDV